MRFNRSFIIAIIIGSTLTGCEKYLDLPPKGRLVPETTADYRKLLDNAQDLNATAGLAELGTDNIIIEDLAFLSLDHTYEKGSYTWAKELFTSVDQIADWNTPYRQIYHGNLVLEGMQKTSTGTERERNTVMGEAYFYRAYGLFTIASMFCVPYDSARAATELGAPIRLSSDVFEKSSRSTLQQTYDQVISDLQQAISLLPVSQEFKTRPARTAAYALLSRLYLYAGNYDLALNNALKALELNSYLINYSTLDPMGYPVFPKFNNEILFFMRTGFEVSYTWQATLNPELYSLYESNDLRKTLFFNEYPGNGGTVARMNASYADFQPFTGIANDEVYLTAAECFARKNQLPDALHYLNHLLQNRYEAGSYTDFQSNDQLQVLTKVLTERRKEFPYRFLRWFDLRRLNKDPRFAITLERTVAGKQYLLPPNDPRYTYPIPQNVIDVTKIEQNKR